MQALLDLLGNLKIFLPVLITLVFISLLLSGARYLLLKRADTTTESLLSRQLIMSGLSLLALILVILSLPISDATRGDLLSLFGLVLTGIFALSSTSFVSNAMAGVMLRSVKSFRQGDFIHVDQHFGRVTERGLFHTEIQTESRDLLTLPNLYLASNAVTVVRSSGTIISCDLSLGYDVPHHQVQPLLKEAAQKVGLQEPFVQVIELGDFSILYRVSGYYPEVKHLLTTRSRLKEQVLDQLHDADIEIVSPTFMNQRQVGDRVFTAEPKDDRFTRFASQHPAPEALIFDKADRAEKIHILEQERKSLVEELKAFTNGDSDPKSAQADIAMREQRIQQLDNIIRIAKEKSED